MWFSYQANSWKIQIRLKAVEHSRAFHVSSLICSTTVPIHTPLCWSDCPPQFSTKAQIFTFCRKAAGCSTDWLFLELIKVKHSYVFTMWLHETNDLIIHVILSGGLCLFIVMSHKQRDINRPLIHLIELKISWNLVTGCFGFNRMNSVLQFKRAIWPRWHSSHIFLLTSNTRHAANKIRLRQLFPQRTTSEDAVKEAAQESPWSYLRLISSHDAKVLVISFSRLIQRTERAQLEGPPHACKPRPGIKLSGYTCIHDLNYSSVSLKLRSLLSHYKSNGV